MELYYKLDRKRMGTAVIINNLDTEQPPTRKDVQSMTNVLEDLGRQSTLFKVSKVLLFTGFDVEIFTDLTGKHMNDLKRKFTEESKHRESNCFILLIIGYYQVL